MEPNTQPLQSYQLPDNDNDSGAPVTPVSNTIGDPASPMIVQTQKSPKKFVLAAVLLIAMLGTAFALRTVLATSPTQVF
ncbi:MAG: hypothetical protein WBP03_04000 [Candidatus Saccharimonadales bacterium]